MIDTVQTALILGIIAVLIRMSRQPMNHRRKKVQGGVVLDSCALIDGRVVELARAGFIASPLIVPEFILHELQLLADGRDTHKRERARYGLDVVKTLQSITTHKVIIDRHPIAQKQATDDKLLILCKQLNTELFTTDFNLIKLAEIENIKVLNVNELSGNLRTITLPGEKINLKIVQKGSNPRQGVGYLDDGTMVVVDGANKFIGQEISAEVVKSHQTVAGKMIFAKLVK